jgi:HlyD family secretion protein
VGRPISATNNKPNKPSRPTTFGSEPKPHPFQANNPTTTNSALSTSKPWSFTKTVLLRKQPRSSSVLVWSGVGTVVVLGIWAISAPLAETIAVEGKLEPGSSTKRIDTAVPGVVEEVLVEEGQQVRQGDPLVRFDLREARSRLLSAESVREQLLNENRIAAATLGDPAAISGLTTNQQRQLKSQAEEFASRRNSARQELRKAEVAINGYRSTLATYKNIADRYANLVAQGAISEVQLLEANQKVDETRSQIAQQEREIDRLRSALINTGATTNVELRRSIEENLSRITELDRDIQQARQLIQYGQITSPADGTVFDIEVSTGSVVAQGTGTNASTSSKPLMKVVPRDALQARVYLPNATVGFVRPGQKAQLSINAFEASDFGTIPATVQRIASDALTSDEQNRALGKSAEGLYYPAILKLEQQTISIRKKEAPLRAGMTLTADIKLRDRRAISIFTGFFEDQRKNFERIR